VLNRLDASGRRPDDAKAIEQYRAFCLIALNRQADAERAIAAVVAADPSYRPPDAEFSPRVRTAFTEVRRRVLPNIVQQKYTKAKSAYDNKQYDVAAAGFAEVLAIFSDPDLGPAGSQPPLSDIRMLAAGFGDLSAKAAAPPPPPLPPPAPVQAPVVVAPPPPTPNPRRIYSAEDPKVVPPAIVRQVLPPFPASNVPTGTGTLEIVIDENGGVESAAMRTSVNAIYDRLALTAAKTWRYKPATVDGQPVKFRKQIVITLKQ
jgi:periplasmic protein TonB